MRHMSCVKELIIYYITKILHPRKGGQPRVGILQETRWIQLEEAHYELISSAL